MENLYQLLSTALQNNRNAERAQLDKRFHRYSHFVSLGIQAPMLVKILRPFKKEFTTIPLANALDIAKKCYAQKIEEYALAGTFILQNNLYRFELNDVAFLDIALENMHSWSTVDDFCIDVVQPLLQKYPEHVINLVKKWNRSKNIWKKRASVVAFVRKIGSSGDYTDLALTLCKNLIHDQEDLVQKGIGWCLKDNMRGNKEKVLAYVLELRKHKAPAVITLYALRDIRGDERRKILKDF